MGTNELKTSASVRAVTKGIAERTGWAKFEDNRRFLVTLADTPGLADTEGDDEKNIPILKDYINSVGTRLGVTAFLLVFKIDSSVDNIMAILKTFNDIMHDFPNVWDNVILVFTGCDYRREILDTKQLLHRELKKQILENILQNPPPRPSVPTEPSTSSTATCSSMEGPSGSTSSPSASRSATTFENTDSAVGVPMVFLTTAENICLIALGGAWCDCEEHAQYMKTALKRLWYEARKMKRWVIDADEGDYEFIGHA
ncbi:hypothetical protein BC939DRAFT_474752 [Gamsiella multidivaricata]|uniref:uncharacterized protein n=1 Tax=Gamsiella multidivaricata TaxID=101098 RepID=UPI002220D024|nr:uncharacterized protein BC939DRAFT_474752 [Gamsiella multidivaricata]KAI7828573.1 hypothetical protein BC939DRAFT_474752 [Gamsiella multidivaricata]